MRMIISAGKSCNRAEDRFPIRGNGKGRFLVPEKEMLFVETCVQVTMVFTVLERRKCSERADFCDRKKEDE